MGKKKKEKGRNGFHNFRSKRNPGKSERLSGSLGRKKIFGGKTHNQASTVGEPDISGAKCHPKNAESKDEDLWRIPV